MNSADGSTLFIDGVLAVSNTHSATAAAAKSGTVTLTQGQHTIEVGYYQNTGNFSLSMSVTLPFFGSGYVPNYLLTANQSMIGPLSGDSGATVALSGTGTNQLIVNQTDPGIYAGTINGAGGSLVKWGIATLTLNGVSNYTGGTTITAGTLQLGDGIANNGVIIGSVADNAVLAFANPAEQTYADTISGNGAVTKSGAGTLHLSSANGYSGGTVVTAGILEMDNLLALGSTGGSLAVTGGTLDLHGNSPTFGALLGSAAGVITSFGSAGNVSLTVSTNSGSSTTYAGSLQDGPAATVALGAGGQRQNHPHRQQQLQRRYDDQRRHAGLQQQCRLGKRQHHVRRRRAAVRPGQHAGCFVALSVQSAGRHRHQQQQCQLRLADDRQQRQPGQIWRGHVNLDRHTVPTAAAPRFTAARCN